MNTPDYADTINALVAQLAADKAAADARAWRLKAASASATEAETLMRPLTAVMESHPDIQLIDEDFTSPSGESVFRRVYRRRAGLGLGPCIVAATLDPPGVACREIYLKTDSTSHACLSNQARIRGKAVVSRADALIPVALEWCAKLIAPQP